MTDASFSFGVTRPSFAEPLPAPRPDARGHDRSPAAVRLAAVALGALVSALDATRPAAADHGVVPLGPERMSPIVVGVIAGALALAIGVAVVAIVALLARKPPRSS